LDSYAKARSGFARGYDLRAALCRSGSIIALVQLFALAAHAQVLQPAAFISLRSSVVRVEAEGERGRLFIGSGVTVAPGVVVTNCHVTRNATTVRIAGSGSLWEVNGQYADGNHDLCFLRAPTWRGNPVALSERDSPQLGEAVAAIGFTGGTRMSLRFGNVSGLHFLDGGRVIESDAAFTSGASGGGLFDASGALVGLLTFRSRGELGSYYSVPVRWIRERLPRDDQWAEVLPLHADTPFWQRYTETLP